MKTKNVLNIKNLLMFSLVLTIFASCKKEETNNPPVTPAGIAGTITDAFFEKVTYIGAFGTTDWTTSWANWNPQNTSYPTITDTLTGNITSNKTLSASKTYFLKGFVYVQSGVTLTIEAGTVIRGDRETKGTLIIKQGAKLEAIGTSAKPIVFTSNKDAGSRTYGDWGGVILCGNAKINVQGGTSIVEGGPDAIYGGTIDDDNSGTLKYVRIEFAGVALQENKEINGLTMGGVGSKTTLDYVQVSYCGDDSFEWFGGKVNAKHLISFRAWDDDFDTDYGYSGLLQFLVSLRDPSIADVSGSNGFESDNDGTGSSSNPVTTPIFSNVSMFGPKATMGVSPASKHQNAMHIRRNSQCNVYNSVFAGYKEGLKLDGTKCEDNAKNDRLKIRNTIISGISSAEMFKVASSGATMTTTEVKTWYMKADYKNDTISDNVNLKITDPFNLNTPNFIPQAGSPVLNKASFN